MEKRLTVKEIEHIISEMDMDSALKYLYALEIENKAIEKLKEKYIKKKEAYQKELQRLENMSSFEKQAYNEGYNFIAGIDEAGRGPLAGPVVAAAVILPKNVFIEKLNDSKKLSPKQRDALYDEIMDKSIDCAVGIVDEKCIDEINILNATKKAMKIAIESLKTKPDLILTDAVNLDTVNIDQVNIVKGDSLSISIAAASIIAKVTRDRLIDKYDSIYPQYGFSKHKGYGTKEHIDAIKKYGICPIHRVSFIKNLV